MLLNCDVADRCIGYIKSFSLYEDLFNVLFVHVGDVGRCRLSLVNIVLCEKNITS